MFEARPILAEAPAALGTPSPARATIELGGAWELSQVYGEGAPGWLKGRVLHGLFTCLDGRISGANALGWVWYGALAWDGPDHLACELLADPTYLGDDAMLPGADGRMTSRLSRLACRLPIVASGELLCAAGKVMLGEVETMTTLRRVSSFRPLIAL